MGRLFHDSRKVRYLLLATVFTAGIVAPAGPAGWLAAPSALAVALGMGIWMHRRLGGLTGDVYGAAIEMAEVAFLALAATLTGVPS